MGIYIMITVMIVFVVDYSGVMDTIKRWIWRWLNGNKPYQSFSLKPFDCSLCMSWWVNLIVLLCNGISMVGMMYVVICCICTQFIYDMMIIIKEGLKWCTDRIMDNLML